MLPSRLVDALFPSACFGCRAVGELLCAACRPGAAFKIRLGPANLDVVAVGPYAGALKRAVLAYKRGRRDVGDTLATLLATRLARALPASAVLVPVTTAAHRRRARGFDQGVRLAERLGEALGVPVLVALERRAATPQHGRSRAARLAARGRFGCASATMVQGMCVVLVDDVVTTGATLAECAAVLRAHGAVVRTAAVIAIA